MPSTPTRPLSNQLIINTHNLSQAHNRGSPRSANASSGVHAFKDSMRPPIEKRLSYGPSNLGPNAHGNQHSQGNGNGFVPSPKTGGVGHHSNGGFHFGHPQRSRQSLALTLLRILAGAPGFLGLMYSLNVAWENKLDGFQRPRRALDGRDMDLPLTRSDFWVASMWCGLSAYWAFLLTTALSQRLLQSYRPPNVVLRIALAHLASWICIGAIIQSRPATEPTRPWVIITFTQALLIFAIVYLPWLRSYMQAAGFPPLSEKLVSHPLEDGFMGKEIGGRSATRYLVLPFILVGLCSWMLIITRGQADGLEGRMPGGEKSENAVSGSPFSGFSSENVAPAASRLPGSRIVISVIVLSSATPQGRINRQLFRDTTLKLFPSPRNQAALVQYRFVIGHPPEATLADIHQELDLTDDLLIVEDAPDTPDGKTLKLYKAIEWANALDFDYLVKTDDDVLVRMDILSGELFKLGPRNFFWKGLVFKNVPNTRLDDMDLKEMPKFTDGTLTTLSRDIVRLLAQAAPRYMLASSAQSLGIWLHGYGIQPIHDIRIQPGAFVCEENLIAKHFDNEPSVMRQPHEDPRTMVDRINKIRSELRANKNNPSFQTQLTICDERIQRRCALCYRCTKRAANWKHMGFDCKPGGVVVGDKYRKPEMLDAKQMDELLNRPSTGISDELDVIPLRDSRPEARYRQQQLQREEEQRQRELDLEQLKQLDAAGEDDDEEDGNSSSVEDDNFQGSTDESNETGDDERPVIDDSTAEEDTNDEGEGEQASENEGGDADQGSEGDQTDNGGDGSDSSEDHGSRDESDIHISDKEFDYLDRRQDKEGVNVVPPVVKKSLSGSKPNPKKKTGRS